MSDIFGLICSESNTESQMTEDFCFIPGQPTQSQSSIHLNQNNPKEMLETIEEEPLSNLNALRNEESSFKTNNNTNFRMMNSFNTTNPPSNTSNNKGGNMGGSGNMNTMNISMNEKFQLVSQEMDDVIEEITKSKASSVNKLGVQATNGVANNINKQGIGQNQINQMNNGLHANNNPFLTNNNSTNQFMMTNNDLKNNYKNQQVSNSSNLQMKNNQMKGGMVSSSNNFIPNSYQNNLKNQSSTNFNNNTMKTKGKISTNNIYLSKTNNNFTPNTNYDSLTFLNTTEEMIANTMQTMEDLKTNFCSLVDKYKERFLVNAELLKEILFQETEFTIQEEEKNKVLDDRIETLFREMMNILNEFSSLYYKN